MDDLGDLFAGGLCLSVGIAVIVAIVAALVYLVRKTKEEEAAAKLEIQHLIKSLPRESQTAFMVQYNAQKKNPTTAVILALLLGGLGAHKFYLGQTGMGILYLLFCWTYIPSIVAFIEAFTISRKVIQVNRQVARETAAILGGDTAALLSLMV